MNQLTIAQEHEALYNAAHRANLDAHIKHLSRKSDAFTAAEKLMLMQYHKDMPVKASYLYCDSLDACFFFNTAGKACVTISAFWGYGTADLGEPIEKALKYIREMLQYMTDEVNRWTREGMDERH